MYCLRKKPDSRGAQHRVALNSDVSSDQARKSMVSVIDLSDRCYLEDGLYDS